MSHGEVPMDTDHEHKDRNVLSLEGAMAQKCLSKYKVGDMVEFTIYGKVEEAVSKSKKPEYGPQHSISIGVTEKGVKGKDEGNPKKEESSSPRRRGRYK